ncbi:MAG: DUF4214 domain-containing protein, partial [Pseudomonadota bacterium]
DNPDVTEQFLITLTGANAGLFDVNNFGEISLAQGQTIDFEAFANPTFDLTVTVTTLNGDTYEEDITLTVVNQPLTAVNAALATAKLPEDASAGTLVATLEGLEGTVLEPGATFSIESGADGNFVIVGNEVRVSDTADLEFNDQSNYLLTISGADGTGPAVQTTVNVELESVGPILGTPNKDNLIGSPNDDEMFGLAEDDVLNASLGNDLLDGGPGNDTAKYFLNRADITQDLMPDGTITVLEPGNTTDTLRDIERIDLDDGDYVYDIGSDNLGFGYRIYQAAFGRTPDEGGVRFWIDVLDQLDVQGQDEVEKQQFVAREFNGSQEFQSLYGANPSNETYIDAMYLNVLLRLPDQSGRDFWVDAMERGQTREEVLVLFAESPENVNNNIPNLDDGVWVL